MVRHRGILLALLAVSLFAPSSAAAARSEFFGIVQGQQFDLQDLERIGPAGIRTERHLFNWSTVQPSQGSFDWDVTDRFIGRLASHGIRSMPFMWGNPGWVAGSQATPPLESTADRQAWKAFLRAAVARYGPGGSYWANGYVQQFGADATPLPIQSWQIWNEPNLAKYFAPNPSPAKYAQLLRMSRDAIKSQDPLAQIVLAGMVGYTDTKAWDFLDDLYEVGAVKGNFNVAALHPYGSDLERVENAFQQFRRVMKENDDEETPLWVTEIGWGSNPPDNFGINKGLQGQERMLRRSFQLILNNRSVWNVQRLFWFFWRDPATHKPGTCSFCSSAGLLRHNRTAKPAYTTFRGFTAETDPPQAMITSGPSAGSSTNDPTPSFSFASDEPGSTFVCRVNPSAVQALQLAAHPRRRSRTAHTPSRSRRSTPRATRARSSRAPSRSTPKPPAAPQITDTDPNSPAPNNTPKVKGSAETPSTVKIYRTVGCTGSPPAVGLRRAILLPRPQRWGRRRHDNHLPRHRDRRRRQRLAVLERFHIRGGLDPAGNDDHLRAAELDHQPQADLRVFVQRGELDLQVSLRLPAVRPLLGAGGKPQARHPALRRLAQLRRSGHRQGQQHRPDSRSAHVHRHPLTRPQRSVQEARAHSEMSASRRPLARCRPGALLASRR